MATTDPAFAAANGTVSQNMERDMFALLESRGVSLPDLKSSPALAAIKKEADGKSASNQRELAEALRKKNQLINELQAELSKSRGGAPTKEVRSRPFSGTTMVFFPHQKFPALTNLPLYIHELFADPALTVRPDRGQDRPRGAGRGPGRAADHEATARGGASTERRTAGCTLGGRVARGCRQGRGRAGAAEGSRAYPAGAGSPGLCAGWKESRCAALSMDRREPFLRVFFFQGTEPTLCMLSVLQNTYKPESKRAV